MTAVVFRRYPEGDVLALMPELPADEYGRQCESYQHVGQHGAADYGHCINTTRPAIESEYADLKAELERIGYDVEVRQRETRAMREARRTEARS